MVASHQARLVKSLQRQLEAFVFALEPLHASLRCLESKHQKNQRLSFSHPRQVPAGVVE
jgi:hypothetical protein